KASYLPLPCFKHRLRKPVQMRRQHVPEGAGFFQPGEKIQFLGSLRRTGRDEQQDQHGGNESDSSFHRFARERSFRWQEIPRFVVELGATNHTRSAAKSSRMIMEQPSRNQINLL